MCMTHSKHRILPPPHNLLSFICSLRGIVTDIQVLDENGWACSKTPPGNKFNEKVRQTKFCFWKICLDEEDPPVSQEPSQGWNSFPGRNKQTKLDKREDRQSGPQARQGLRGLTDNSKGITMKVMKIGTTVYEHFQSAMHCARCLL